MTLLEPGQFWSGLEVQNNPAFQARHKSVQAKEAEEFFARAIYAAELAHRQGYPLTVATLRESNNELPKAQLRELMGTDKFVNALADRGIEMRRAKGLSAKQMAMAAIFLDTSNPATLSQKLRMAKVTRAEWDSWMLQAEFADRVSALAEDRVKQLVPLAEVRLEQAVDAGAPWALQFAFALTKRFDPRSEAADPTAAIREIQAALDAVLPQEMLEQVLDYIQARRDGRATPPAKQIATQEPAEWTVAADTIAPTEESA